MMREILFRGKRLDNGEWIEGYVYGCHDGTYDICSYNKKSNIERYGYEVMPSTIGQYSGLTDKDGKKIFEGDILQTSDRTIFIVEWEKDGRFLGFTIGKKRRIVYINREPKAEIIGNIHDNPELLEE